MQDDDAAGGGRGLGLSAPMATEESKLWMQRGRGWKEAEVKDTCSQGPRRSPSYIEKSHVTRGQIGARRAYLARMGGAAKPEAAAASPQLQTKWASVQAALKLHSEHHPCRLFLSLPFSIFCLLFLEPLFRKSDNTTQHRNSILLTDRTPTSNLRYRSHSLQQSSLT